METIMPPNYMGGAARIIAEIRNRTCIDDNDAEVIKGILKAAIHEYYEDGHSDGYDDGYEHGYVDCRAKNYC